MDSRSHSAVSSGRLNCDLSGYRIPHLLHLGRLQYSRASKPLTPHLHAGAMEICFLARGRQSYVVGSQEYNLRGGDVFITFPDEQHSTGGRPEERSILYWLLVDLTPGRPFLGIPGAESRKLRQSLINLPCRHFTGTPGMRNMLDRILALGTGEQEFSATRLRALATLFMLEVIDRAGRMPCDLLTPAIAAVREYVRTNISEPIMLQDMAHQAGMSLSHFKRRFKREVGMPPREYVLREKVEAARRMLSGSNRTITDIAFSLGFSSSAYFSTVFKRFTGKPPSAVVRA